MTKRRSQFNTTLFPNSICILNQKLSVTLFCIINPLAWSDLPGGELEAINWIPTFAISYSRAWNFLDRSPWLTDVTMLFIIHSVKLWRRIFKLKYLPNERQYKRIQIIKKPNIFRSSYGNRKRFKVRDSNTS